MVNSDPKTLSLADLAPLALILFSACGAPDDGTPPPDGNTQAVEVTPTASSLPTSNTAQQSPTEAVTESEGLSPTPSATHQFITQTEQTPTASQSRTATQGETAEPTASPPQATPSIDPVPIVQIEARTLSSPATVIEVTWKLNIPGRTWLEFACGEDDLCTSPIIDSEANSQSQFMLGLKADTDVEFAVLVESNGIIQKSETQVHRTGALPSELPKISLGILDPLQIDDPYILVSSLGGSGPPSILILDRNGNVVWYQSMKNWSPSAYGWAAPTSFVAPDGTIVFGLHPFNFNEGLGTIEWVSLDNQQVRSEPAVGSHHTFTQLPDGSVTYITEDPAQVDGIGTVIGDKLIEISPDGTTRTIFSTWDWGSPNTSNWPEPDGEFVEWTHANSVFYNEKADSYLFSLHSLQTILEIDRASGQVLYQFNGAGGGYDCTDPLYEPNAQHGLTYTEDGNLMMVIDIEAETVAVEYSINHLTRSFSPVWSYGQGLKMESFAYGGAERLSNGNTLINFGTQAEIHEVLPDGTVVWSAWMEGSGGIGLTQTVADIYSVFAETRNTEENEFQSVH